MNTIIPLHQSAINGDLQATVDARELHTFLEVGKDFSTWIKDRIDQFNFTQGIDFCLLPNSGEQKTRIFGRGGHNKANYALTLDMAKELAMLERSEKGRQARQYFIGMEKHAKAQVGLLVKMRDELVKTNPQWQKIQRYHDAGLTNDEMTQLLGISTATLGRIKCQMRGIGLMGTYKKSAFAIGHSQGGE